MSSPHPPPAPASVTLVPPERTAIFPREKAAALLQAAVFFKPAGITGYWTPAPADLVGVEDGLADYLAAQKWVPHQPWSDYYRQVAGLERDGGRSLFLSYFVIEPETQGGSSAKWKDEAYWMNDGGDTFFRVIYDLQKKGFTWYERNNDP